MVFESRRARCREFTAECVACQSANFSYWSKSGRRADERGAERSKSRRTQLIGGIASLLPRSVLLPEFGCFISARTPPSHQSPVHLPEAGSYASSRRRCLCRLNVYS